MVILQGPHTSMGSIAFGKHLPIVQPPVSALNYFNLIKPGGTLCQHISDNACKQTWRWKVQFTRTCYWYDAITPDVKLSTSTFFAHLYVEPIIAVSRIIWMSPFLFMIMQKFWDVWGRTWVISHWLPFPFFRLLELSAEWKKIITPLLEVEEPPHCLLGAHLTGISTCALGTVWRKGGEVLGSQWMDSARLT